VTKEISTMYQESAAAMDKNLRAAGDHIAALLQMDLDPTDLAKELALVKITLAEVQYHTERMQVYANLLRQDRAVFNKQG
jgi:hypothetical protein